MRLKSNPRTHSVFYPTARRVTNLGILVLIGYAGYLLGYFLMYKTALFPVEKIVVSGNKYLAAEFIRREAKIDTNQTLFQVNPAEVTHTILENDYIRGVSVSRELPSTIIIDIQERVPVLYLVDKSLYMVDETGVMLKLLPQMPVGKLPVITGLSLNELLKDRTPLFQAIELAHKIQEVDESLLTFISEIHLDRKAYPELYLVQGGAHVRLGKSDHYQRLYLLSELLTKKLIVTELANIKRIDLTFSNRIIIQKKS